jgi:hypothetical protein
LDINKILAGLRLEHEQLGEAIVSIERLAMGGAKRRGRPPAWLSNLKEKRGPGRPARSKSRNSLKTKAAPEKT